jgi:hypothetical protein
MGRSKVCANVFVNKGDEVVEGKDILPVAWSNAPSRSLETRARADPLSIILGGAFSTINSVTTATMIAYSDTQSLLGARAPTQPVGLACADIRIASLRAVATLATVKCF